MTTLIELLRREEVEGHRICGQAADEVEGLELELHTERAAVAGLRAEIACLRDSAALRVQFHAAELADVTAELANAKASGIHSCHDGCTRSGCVAGRLTAERDALRADADRYLWLRDKARTVDWSEVVGTNGHLMHCRIGPLGMDAAIDAARVKT